ncbi:MAG: hypothetical protein J7L63_04460 [Thermoplasmata archaeon]|nr:hypothetical protein [Thermoplasmata archaeon]
MLVNLKELLKKLFELNNIEILDREPTDFIWAKYEDFLELVYVEEEKVVDGDYVINFSRMTEEVHANKTIICVKGYTDDAKSMAHKMGIELLNRAEFANLIGEFILEIYEKKRIIPLELFQEEDIEVEEMEEESEDTIPIFLEEISPQGEERIIKLQISEDQAAAIAKGYVHGFHQKLVLLPYYVFEYSLEVLIEGSIQTKSAKGIIAVNGVSKKFELWKKGFETVVTIELEHERLEPVIGLEEAKGIAEVSIEKEYSREEEVKIEGENVTIIEKRKTRPKKGSINLNFISLYYLPVWIIEGRDGLVMINGATGEIMKENFYGTIF